MSQIKNKIIEITSSLVWVLMLVFAMFSLAPMAQAEPVPNSLPFDHTKTGFILRDIHTTLKCEQCHVGGVFKNTPKDCAGCHSIGSRVGATAKPVNHVITTFACDVCHVSPTSFLVKSYKHFGVINGCDTCHGAQSGQSIGVVKFNPAIHVATNLSCETCHTNTSTFLGAKMNHIGITSDCATCHSGQYPNVVKVPAMHIPIPVGTDCGICHRSTTTFLGAVYDHSTAPAPGVINNCNSCHNNTYPGVKGLTATHIPTAAAQCDTCHTQTNTVAYSTFLGVTYHNGATPVVGAICSTCHTGAIPGVQGTSFYAPHKIITPGTVPPCSNCHTAINTVSYTTFLGATFDSAAHATAGVVSPGSPTGSLACATCHNGTTAQTFAQPHVVVNTATTSCASCHTNSLTTMSWLGASFIHPSSIVSPSASPTGANACGTCHNGTTAQTYVAPHVAINIATTKCDSCHTTSLSTLSWLGAQFIHTAAGISSTKALTGTNACSTCHNGTTAQTYVQPHAVINNATQACDTCHTTAMSTYSWLGATFVHPAGVGGTTTVANVGPSCISCHVTGGSASTWVPPHSATPAGTACETCHTTALSTLSWLGATFVHAAITPAIVSPSSALAPAANACGTCHFTGGSASVTYIQPHVTINPATTTCDVCHTTALSSVSWLGAKFVHTAPGINISSTGATSGPNQCASCHNGTLAQTYVPPHAATTASTACDSCHTGAMSTYSWLGAQFNHAANVPPVVSPSTSPTGPIACATCHNGTTAQTYVQPHVNVNTATTTCDSCHTTAMTSYSWLGAAFLHPASVISPSSLPPPDVNACGTCHNGTTASSFVAPHAGAFASATMTASSKCDDCHIGALTSLSWTGMTLTVAGLTGTGTFVHTDVTGYPAACATCHTGAYAQGKPTSHVVTAAACDSCHTTALGSLSWLGATGVDHTAVPMIAGGVTATTGATGNCQLCHNGTVAKGISAGHIPTTGFPSCDTGGCHVVGTATTFAPGNMGASQHTLAAATRCDLCHSGAYSTQGITLGGAVGKVATHIPTTITGSLDCNTCHKTGSPAGFQAIAGAAGWVTVKGQMNHNSAQGGAPNYCVTCHLSGVTYMGSMQKKSHNGASTAKDCSVSGCHKPLGSKGTSYSSWT